MSDITDHLEEIERDWLQICGVHDAGLSTDCGCFDGDPRIPIQWLVQEFRDKISELDKERNKAGRAQTEVDRLRQELKARYDEESYLRAENERLRSAVEVESARVDSYQERCGELTRELDDLTGRFRESPHLAPKYYARAKAAERQLDEARADVERLAAQLAAERAKVEQVQTVVDSASPFGPNYDKIRAALTGGNR